MLLESRKQEDNFQLSVQI